MRGATESPAVPKSTLPDDLFLVFIMAIWGLNFVLTKVALREFDVFTLALIRNVIALATMVVVFLAIQRRWPTRPTNLRRLAMVGFTGVTLNQILFISSIQYTSSTNASLISSATPVFGLIFARILEHERATWKRWLGVAVSLGGVALIVGGGKAGFSFGQEGTAGDLFMLGAAATYSLFAILGRPLLKQVSSLELMIFAYLIGTPLLIVPPAGTLFWDAWSALTTVGWAAAIGLGINTSATSVLFYRQIGRVGPSRAMVFMYLAPISGAVLSVLFLSETISLLQGIGAVVVILGVNTARTG